MSNANKIKSVRVELSAIDKQIVAYEKALATFREKKTRLQELLASLNSRVEIDARINSLSQDSNFQITTAEIRFPTVGKRSSDVDPTPAPPRTDEEKYGMRSWDNE